MSSSWDPGLGDFPWPPANATAMNAFHSSDVDLRWDNPSILNTGASETSTRASVTLSVESVPVAWIRATGSFEVVGIPSVGDYIEILGILITAINGTPSKDEFDVSSSNLVTIAQNITSAINSGSCSTLEIVTARSVNETIELTPFSDGEVGNNVTLSSSTPDMVASGETLSGGVSGHEVFLANLSLKARTTRTLGNNDFSNAGTIAEIATSIKEAINDKTNYFGLFTSDKAVNQFTAGANGKLVTIYSAQYGAIGNKIPVLSKYSSLVFSSSKTSGGTGAPCEGKSNSEWNIIGVNIYRSDTGDRGPYFRVNRFPISSLFYRDHTNIVEQVEELVPWEGGWIFKGDGGNNRGWRLRSRNTPMVKAGSNAIPADSEFDVTVKINGVEVPVRAVFGPKGEVDLDIRPIWDPATETEIQAKIPTSTDIVTISYSWKKGNKLINTLDNRHKVFYRLTTVAVDPTGTSPTGLLETPLGYSEPISPMNSEKMDYIWREAIRRNRWILEQGGERVKLFIRRVNGNSCDCVWDARLQEYSKQPLNTCLRCYGTGWVGGYEGPIDIIIAPDDAERTVAQTMSGRRLEHSYEVWIGPSPMTSQRDFIVKQNGERYSIGPVRRTQVRGLILQQTFNIAYLDMGDIRYQVPMSDTKRLPWPQTRFTSPELSECQSSDPHPVGFDYQAAPMMSDKKSIPENRQQRGRTPVWQNITYGGKGDK